MSQKFPDGICPKKCCKKSQFCFCDICNLWVHIKCNKIRKLYYRKFPKDKDPCYCKECIKNIIPCPYFSDNQINNLMLRTLMTSPKQLHVIFPNGKQSSVITNEIFTADNFHKHRKALLPSNLYLHIKISSLSYHIDNLNSLITNWQVKPKTIGINDSRLKKNKKFFQTLI